MWPGNNLAKLEWTPKQEYQSAGLATTQTHAPEVRPDRHPRDRRERPGQGQEALRAVAVDPRHRARGRRGRHPRDGGDRHRGRRGARRRPDPARGGPRERADLGARCWRTRSSTSRFPNPDGWRRGSVGDTDKGPGVFFQRYNGNGIDPNRDWPDIGYSFRPYSGGSEPETRAFQTFYRQRRGARRPVRRRRRPARAAVRRRPVVHADAARPHDIDKDYRIREASKLINRAQYEATKWSPLIQDNDQPPPDCIPEDAQALGAACDQIYAQTWGSVYDTINYTTTGTLGDWFDSSIGLGADGIDNEMSFSHLDRNIAFEPHGEQLHVAGNKAIIYSHIADLLRPPGDRVPDAPAQRLRPERPPQARRAEIQPGAPPGTTPAGRHDRRGTDHRGPRAATRLRVRGRSATRTPTTAACASTSRDERAGHRPRRRDAAGPVPGLRRRTYGVERGATTGSRSPRTTTSRRSTPRPA